MPEGLLDTFKENEILDLMAYLLSLRGYCNHKTSSREENKGVGSIKRLPTPFSWKPLDAGRAKSTSPGIEVPPDYKGGRQLTRLSKPHEERRGGDFNRPGKRSSFSRSSRANCRPRRRSWEEPRPIVKTWKIAELALLADVASSNATSTGDVVCSARPTALPATGLTTKAMPKDRTLILAGPFQRGRARVGVDPGAEQAKISDQYASVSISTHLMGKVIVGRIVNYSGDNVTR